MRSMRFFHDRIHGKGGITDRFENPEEELTYTQNYTWRDVGDDTVIIETKEAKKGKVTLTRTDSPYMSKVYYSNGNGSDAQASLSNSNLETTCLESINFFKSHGVYDSTMLKAMCLNARDVLSESGAQIIERDNPCSKYGINN